MNYDDSSLSLISYPYSSSSTSESLINNAIIIKLNEILLDLPIMEPVYAAINIPSIVSYLLI